MPIWSYFAIWIVFAFAIALILGHAFRAIDEDYPLQEQEREPQLVEWPEFRALRAERERDKVLR